MKVTSRDEKAITAPLTPTLEPISCWAWAGWEDIRARYPLPLHLPLTPHISHIHTHTHTHTQLLRGVSQRQPLAGVKEGSDGGWAAGPSGVLGYSSLLMEFLPRPASQADPASSTRKPGTQVPETVGFTRSQCPPLGRPVRHEGATLFPRCRN